MPRVAGCVILLAVGGALTLACGDDLQDGGNARSLQISLSFPSSAADVVPVAGVRVTATRSGGQVALDTVVAVTAGTLPVNVTVQVPVTADGDTYTVELDLRDAQGVTVFTGVTNLSVTQGSGTQVVQVALTYAATGADAASVRITSTDSLLEVLDTLTLTASAFDASNNPLPGTPIKWTSADPSVAGFPSPTAGTLVSTAGGGRTTVTAALVTGQTATRAITVLPQGSVTLLRAIDSLEAALFTALNAGFSTLDDLDLFSFQPAHDLFADALGENPASNTAAVGLAATTLLMLEDDPQVRSFLEGWEDWLDDPNHNLDLEDLVQAVPPFPPTLSDLQGLLRDVMLPAMEEALTFLADVDSADFTFTITERMQGEAPGLTPRRELDRTDVVAVRAILEAALGAIQTSLAYRTEPSPWGATGFDAALATGSTFGTLAAGGGSLLSAARTRLLAAVQRARDALDLLVAETDDQTDDVLKYSSAAPSGMWDDLDETLGPGDVQDARDVLNDAQGVLDGPFPLSEDFGKGVVTLVVDVASVFLDPVTDLKALLPDYETMNSEFHWTALAFDEWDIPDPTLGGLFPGIPSTDSLKQTIDLTGIYDEGRQYIIEWKGLTQSPGDGDLFAVMATGEVREIAADLSSDVARPGLPPSPGGDWATTAIARNTVTGELVSHQFDRIYTRPDDPGTAWTLRYEPGSCCSFFFAFLVEDPAGTGSMLMLGQDGNLVEFAPDFSTVTDRPDVFWSVEAFAANDQTGQLVALAAEGQLFARPNDAATEWTEVLQLPFERWEDRWTGVTQGPTDGRLFAITASGRLHEILSDYSSVVERPTAPASNVRWLAANRQTGELVAMTEDGRLFTRPDDTGTSWTLRRTLPRTVVGW